MVTDPSTTDVRNKVLRLVVVGAAAGVLLALFFGLKALTRQEAEPLPPDERLGEWRHVSRERKEATVRQLLVIWQEEGKLKPGVAAELASPAREQEIVDVLVAGTDQANNHGSMDYIPPGESIRIVVLDLARKNNWAEPYRAEPAAD